MRFDRYPRIEPYFASDRKRALIATRHVRQNQRIQEAYPLLAAVLPAAQPADVESELERRALQDKAFQQQMRDREAQVWRGARRDYFAASADLRAEIQQRWRSWRGPARASYFLYVVEVATGVQEARSQALRAREQQLRREILARWGDQHALAFTGPCAE